MPLREIFDPAERVGGNDSYDMKLASFFFLLHPPNAFELFYIQFYSKIKKYQAVQEIWKNRLNYLHLHIAVL